MTILSNFVLHKQGSISKDNNVRVEKSIFKNGLKTTSKRPRRSNLMWSVSHNMAILSNFWLHKQVSISKDKKVTAKSKNVLARKNCWLLSDHQGAPQITNDVLNKGFRPSPSTFILCKKSLSLLISEIFNFFVTHSLIYWILRSLRPALQVKIVLLYYNKTGKASNHSADQNLYDIGILPSSR